MKKTVVLIVALLNCCLAFSQEASSERSSGTFMLVPRYDFDYSRSENLDGTISRGPSWIGGHTALYTLLDGNVGEHFSYHICNQWLCAVPRDLYMDQENDGFNGFFKYALSTNAVNWINWANIGLHFGNFSIYLGKVSHKLGDFEADSYDYERFYNMESILWNYYQAYQWGGVFNWTNSAETTSLTLCVTSNQYSDKPFHDKGVSCCFALDQYFGEANRLLANYTHTFGEVPNGNGFKNLLSVSFRRDAPSGFIIEGLAYNDFSTRMAGTFVSTGWNFSDKLSFEVKGGHDFLGKDYDNKRAFLVGAKLFWFPLKESTDLRVHFSSSYNTSAEKLWLTSIGVLYTLNINY